ncbi:hypothetical protein [Natronorubrum halophilum]|uniref:hypothetical protein n=1 Tax=Natronorubrum halophilum TaxID=1702106 RepID=UPI0010C1D158|nr:hypothetical protein [Natronorubrum halophilum]
MNRRSVLRALATGGVIASAGCTESFPFASDQLSREDVFAGYRYDGTALVVEFRDSIDVQRTVLVDSETDEEHETVDHPTATVRFPVVFPDRLETYVTRQPALSVRAETPDGRARQSVWEPVHGAVRNVEPLADGRARFDLENQGHAPLLVRFVAIYDDVPNPTVDPQSDSFDHSSFDPGPGVVGTGTNRPLSPSRTDLVVPAGETKPFETTYAPFAFPDGATRADCDGDERTGKTAVVHASGGSAAYGFTYRLEGESTALEGREVSVCDGGDGARN